MIRTLVTILRILMATVVNKFIYYFKRIPLIGKIMPDAAYGFGDIKVAVTLIASVCKVFLQLFYKALYIGVAAILPIFVIMDDLPESLRPVAYVSILTFMSLLIGSLRKSVLLENSLEKYTCIKLMRMPAKQYALSSLVLHHGGTFLALLPWVIVGGLLCGLNPLAGFWLAILMLMLRICGEALCLKLFQRTKKNLAAQIPFSLALTLLGLAAAYLPFFLRTVFPTMQNFMQICQSVVLSLPFAAIAIILFILSLLYILKYNRYSWANAITINFENLQKTQNFESIKAESRFADVKLNEKKDFKNSVGNAVLSHKQGYHYLNALFFERHKRMLLKPVLITSAIIVGIFLVYVVLWFLSPEEVSNATLYLRGALPLFVFLMYCLSFYGGERACRALFNNCDLSLLRYSFYRQPAVILQNFKIRLRFIASLNLIIAGTLCVAIFLVGLISGIPWNPLDEALFLLGILCLSLFFSVHHLFLYYVFQPYTTDKGMKNPFYNVINGAIYVLCYICLRLNSAPTSFTFLVLGATIVYIGAALALVLKYAPKNFKVK